MFGWWRWRERVLIVTSTDVLLLSSLASLSPQDVNDLRLGFAQAQHAIREGNGPVLIVLPPGVTVAAMLRGPR